MSSYGESGIIPLNRNKSQWTMSHHGGLHGIAMVIPNCQIEMNWCGSRLITQMRVESPRTTANRSGSGWVFEKSRLIRLNLVDSLWTILNFIQALWMDSYGPQKITVDHPSLHRISGRIILNQVQSSVNANSRHDGQLRHLTAPLATATQRDIRKSGSRCLPLGTLCGPTRGYVPGANKYTKWLVC